MGRTLVGALPTALEKSLKTLVTEFLLFFLSIEDVDEDEYGEFNEPIQMDEHDRFQVVKMHIADNAKEVFFIRVYAFHPSAYAFVNKYYVKDEEVLLQYECHAI